MYLLLLNDILTMKMLILMIYERLPCNLFCITLVKRCILLIFSGLLLKHACKISDDDDNQELQAR